MLFVTLGDLASNPLRPYIQQLDPASARSPASPPTARPPRAVRSSGQAGARPELYALGFRNPLGLAFRPGTDDCGKSTSARSAATSSTGSSRAPTTAGR
jgi:glucose/arabinose dehydrogenase